jgi:hypothetical protein
MGTLRRTLHCACAGETCFVGGGEAAWTMSVENRSGVAWNAAKPHGDDHAITNVSKQHRTVISPHPDSVFVENCGHRFETSWAILLQCRQKASALAQAPDGAACATNTDCNSGICNRATGLCTRSGEAGRPEGASCAVNTDCNSGFCDVATGLCARRALGSDSEG